MKKKKEKTSIWVHLFFIAFSLACILPFMMVVSASFSESKDLLRNGFSVLPRKIDLTAYQYLFANPKIIIDGYKVTIFTAIVGVFFALVVMSLTAYPLSRTDFKLKKIVTWYFFFPTLFGGGTVASYIVNTRYLHLTDSIWVLILPGVVSAFQIFMIRTFFQQLPEGLFDAAKIDGASEYGIYFRMAIPLSKPVLASIAFQETLERWNAWYSAMLYIRTKDKYPLQYLLQRMMMSLEELKKNMIEAPHLFTDVTAADIPGENLRMALLIVCIGPMMIIFPFFQKYFTKGMVVGSVKG